MPVAKATFVSPLPPSEVLKIITDFGPGRVDAWPGVDTAHFTVHDSGDGFADVTEGNDTTWERVRYTWDAAAGTIAAVTSESNVWDLGSRWDYTLSPQGSGTQVAIVLTRKGKGLKGALIGALLPLVGAGVIKKSFAGPLRVAS